MERRIANIMEAPLAVSVTLGPMTTATSAAEGRLKMDVAGMKRKKKSLLKRAINSVSK